MSLTIFLRVLRVRWPWAVGVTALCAAAAAGLVMVTPKQYTAETTMLVNFQGNDGPAADAYPASLFNDFVATQMNLIGSRAVGTEAVDALGLQGRPALQARFRRALDGPAAWASVWVAKAEALLHSSGGERATWDRERRDLADALRHRIAVSNTNGSGMLDLSFSSADPWVSEQVVNAFATAYLHTNVRLNAEPAREDAQWFDSQVKQLSDNLEQAQARLSQFQQRHRIVATDERLDTETAKLHDLSSQLTMAQTKSYSLLSKRQQVQDYLSGGASSGLIPDVLNNPVVEHLKEAISDQKRQLSDVAAHVGLNHPDYISNLAELKALQERLADQIGGIAKSIDASVRAAHQREHSLTEAVADQKERVLSLRHNRDRLDLLKTKVDNAQRVYDAALQRMSQARMQSHSTRSSVSLVNIAVQPHRPSGPHVARYLAGGAGAGLALGIAAALWREVRDRRVRSVDDVGELLDIPVFATITPRAAAGMRGHRPPPRLLPPGPGDDGRGPVHDG